MTLGKDSQAFIDRCMQAANNAWPDRSDDPGNIAFMMTLSMFFGLSEPDRRSVLEAAEVVSTTESFKR